MKKKQNSRSIDQTKLFSLDVISDIANLTTIMFHNQQKIEHECFRIEKIRQIRSKRFEYFKIDLFIFSNLQIFDRDDFISRNNKILKIVVVVSNSIRNNSIKIDETNEKIQKYVR